MYSALSFSFRGGYHSDPLQEAPRAIAYQIVRDLNIRPLHTYIT